MAWVFHVVERSRFSGGYALFSHRVSEVRCLVPVSGATPSERYLQLLGRHSFLSLWSHGNPYTPEGMRGGKGVGKELCDLLVIFGNDIVIFSDKYINFNQDIDLGVAWPRWYKKAVAKSAQQVFGAEAWIRQFPRQVYSDPKCQIALPVSIPPASEIRVHRVCLALGAYDACREHFGGSSIGSLMIHSGLNGINEHTEPFIVGNVFPEKGFVHVFDEFSLNAVLRELDTANDLITYLQDREEFLSQDKPVVLAAGEEQLLAIYLTNLNPEGNHGFVLPIEDDEIPHGVYLDESFWDSMISNPQYKLKKEADRVSYLWDKLIEHFISYGEDEEGLSENLEMAYRFMASEPRIRRRQLGHALHDFMMTAPGGNRAIRLVYSSDFSEKAYVFLILPVLEGQSYESYRQLRREMLWAYCNVVKLRCEEANFVIGIAMDSRDSDGGSEDFIALDVSEWGEPELDEARTLQKDAKIFLDENVRIREGRTSEYPDVPKLPMTQNGKSRQADKKKINRKKMQRASRRKNRKKR